MTYRRFTKSLRQPGSYNGKALRPHSTECRTYDVPGRPRSHLKEHVRVQEIAGGRGSELPADCGPTVAVEKGPPSSQAGLETPRSEHTMRCGAARGPHG